MSLEWGLQNVLIESDCLQATLEVHKTRPSFIEGGGLVADIKDLLSMFNVCKITHVLRNLNKLAHKVAKAPIDRIGPVVWSGGLPPFVVPTDLME